MLYNGVALIVIPDCTEAIAFYTKIVTAAHVGVEVDLSCKKGSCLCNKCQGKEQEREIWKGLLISEHKWLHKF